MCVTLLAQQSNCWTMGEVVYCFLFQNPTATSNPPRASPISTIQRTVAFRSVAGVTMTGVELLEAGVWLDVAVSVGGIGVVVGVTVAGPGVSVAVAGSVTNKTSFCAGWMIDDPFNPFQAIKSDIEISYSRAIQDRVSPLLTVW